MAKETVGVRPPEAIAKQVKAYAETHDISRTEAIGFLIRTGLDKVGTERDGRAYTVRIREVQAARDEPVKVGGWKAALKRAELIEGVYDSTEALSARLPGELVRDIEEYADENGLAKSVAAEKLMVRGLKEDPLPEGSEDPIPEHEDFSEAEVKTVELGVDEAELFRRARLWYRKGPSQMVSWLQNEPYSTSKVKIGWEKPEEE